MNLISLKIAKHVDVLKLFASIALRPVSPEQLIHFDVTTHCCKTLALACHVVGTRQVNISPFPFSNATVLLGKEKFILVALLNG